GAVLISAVLIAAALLGILLFGSTVMTSMLITVTAVIGLQIFFGNSGILSFGHAGFMALGAYLCGLMTMPVATKSTVLPQLPAFLGGIELGFLPALALTAIIIGVVATGVGFVIVRLGGYSAAIASLGVLVIVHALLLGLPSLTRGAQTFYG